MLEFCTIRFQNLGSYGDRAFEYDFRASRCTAFTGVNGAGKSTILDATSLVLYGKPWRPVKKAELVNKKNKRGCRVEITFNTSKSSFKVVRGIKPDVFEIWQDGQLLNQDSKSRDYQKMLENDILQMNWGAFNQVVVIGKATYTPFMKLDTADRRAFVESVLSLQIFTAMKEQHRLRASEANRLLLTAQTSLTATRPRVDSAQRNIANYEKMLADPGTVSMADARKKLEALRNQYAALVREEREITYERSNLVNDLVSVWRGSCEGQRVVADEAQHAVDAARIHLRDVIEPDLRAVVDFIRDQTNEAARLRRQASNLDTKTVCPTCSGPIDASNALRHAAEMNASADEADAMALAAQPDRETAEKAVTQYTSDVLNALIATARQESNLLARLEEKDPSKSQYEAPELTAIDDKLAAKRTDCHSIQVSMAAAESEFNSAHRREVELADLMAAANKDLEEARAVVAELEVEERDQSRRVQILQAVAAILKDTGAKATIIRRYIPVINGLVNDMLADMGLFAKFELDEEFNDSILIRGFEEMTYNSLSEGEKLRIDMAVMMSWRELCILTGASATNLLIFDEILDGSFDEQGIEAFMQALNEKDDLNVLCITHHPERIDHYIDRHIKFARDDGYSVYEEVTE